MEMDFEFMPGQPVKFCMNHDDPEFSNPGSSDELNGPDRCETCQETIDHDRVIDEAREKYAEDDLNYTGPDRNEESRGRGED